MIPRAELVQKLRRDFSDGATPSRLIRDILSEMGDGVSGREVHDILSEAFQLPVVHISPIPAANLEGNKRLVLNRTLLPEIVERKEQWRKLASHPHEPSWVNGVKITELQDVRKNVAAGPYPGLSKETWAALSPEEQESLCVQLCSAMVAWERLELLSKLAERLQDKVNELEAKLQSPALSES